ncbi:DSBA-like thioredoxin family protein [Roseovarius sp. EC-HK134]|jgi:predicted DsbA family dithiol-disulfide isomerase|uniref:DsbA family oxidoreductase n=1 Tax=Roseovarius TaxID=74030 RepID=UPI0001557605|nr:MULTISPECIES: DsbA family oxidoreductase [Roseovarius]AWZ22138.1 2-hydroxychromene-2-carboxylate isomerase/DsbA-like thioredoxin domain [Roseovarius sp. AK1035]EDM30410.1 DSBA-like thioredoxin family protein [Roseovarius sp. TM1035]MBW4972414.1 DsbA family oxidoreductase [Roseovarius mucosus]VVT26647.1 DSBA-like thioredoxin family protein [Roseovarius sp. EC-HK134]VVT26764.1 DSBA-like thioredoxin family protein [Roseovarius sp. EC-SD190]|tara:strand:+ start:136 stop:771 length:636 start_codon:yes stop_codon:yes gene_type:complete
MVKLDIISDPICPWCYIGKTLLDQALAQRPDHPFEIEWHPFQLNPDMPAEGMDRRDYLETKFGGKDGAIRAYAPVLERAEAAGLTIDFAAIKRTPNTLDAHRLLHWAGIEGCQDRMAMALFQAYFNEGRDIGDPEVLADLADSLSLDGAMIQRLLATEADREDIRTRDAQFRQMGITGVPTFIVGGQHAVPGCQPTDLWVKVIDDLTAAAS